MRTNAVERDTMEHLLALLTRSNEIACRIALAHGLRIGDVLRLRRWQVEQDSVTIREEKTGKRRRIRWTELQRRMLLSVSGSVYVFEGRNDPKKHRTRQAVWKDIKRASEALRLKGCVGTHSMRKSFAVRKYAACGDMRKVKSLLNHSEEAVTMLYALAECVESRKKDFN